MSPSGGPPAHRGDIDGLRAIAVVAVVLFHAGVPAFRAGFVGVDVFFVVSGFLITSLLVREVERDGRVSVVAFWARRLRRLAPALTAMVIVTLIAGYLTFSPLRWGTLARDGTASAMYVSNIVFARASRGYFAQSVETSPFLHTWSLSVEEQFYVLWPAVILMLVAASHSGRSALLWLKRLLPVAVGTSFGLSWLMTRRGSPWAYYSLPTRWWEIGAGACLAMWWGLDRTPRRWATGIGVVGVAVLIGSMLVITPTTPYPGLAALGPVFSTLCLLSAGSTGGVSMVLSTSPLRWVGNRSYSWYLWHWPVLVIATGFGVAETVIVRVGWVVASLGIAWISYSLVERPIRTSRWTQSTRTTIAISTCLIVAVLTLSGLILVSERREMSDPMLQSLRRATDQQTADLDRTCDPAIDRCGDGPLVIVVGDSHAAHWVPGIEKAVDELGARLIVRTRGGCPPWRIDIAATGTAHPSTACLTFRAETDELIESAQPDVVVLTSGDYTDRMLTAAGGPVDADDEAASWRRAMDEYVDWIQRRSGSVAILVDNPYVPFDPVECIARSRQPQTCEFDSSGGDSDLNRRALADLATDRSLPAFDPLDVICPDRCQTWQSNGPVFSDRTHLVTDFVRSAAPQLKAWLAPLMQEARPDG